MPIARVFPAADADADLLTGIRGLLDLAFAGEFSDADWAHTLGGWHAVVERAGDVVAHGAVVPRVLEVDGAPLSTGYVEGVAVDPARQNHGLGSIVMTELATVIRQHFDMGALSTGRHSLYRRLGWERWAGPTFVRTVTGLVRTRDEDDGVMVLRFGRMANLDLSAAITCEERDGDDW